MSVGAYKSTRRTPYAVRRSQLTVNQDPLAAGWDARMKGLPITARPGGKLDKEWRQGWRAADEYIARESRLATEPLSLRGAK